jgi:fructose-bisphosphate aldolase class I
MNKLNEIVKQLLVQGKGILAADESDGTANKRLEAVGIEATEENRRRYRELLFTTPGVEEYLSGVILFDETMRQSTPSGVLFPELLLSKEILVGIKVDEGLEDISGGQVTKGLETLRKRLNEYKSMGASFTKWRAVARVGSNTRSVVEENAKRLAEYAAIVQEFHMVPMIEPEVLMEGVHSAEDAETTIIETVAIVFEAMKKMQVHLPGVILKTSMAVSGSTASHRASSREVADRTVHALKTSVPDEVGGVVFLSGGQAPEEAAANFNAIARLEPHPWPITFSFSRALQSPVLEEWRGLEENLDEAQAIFLKRVTLAVAADAGGYSENMENSAL